MAKKATKAKKLGAISSNSVSLAGEFAVLSQLALRGMDANMTLGRTKGVDILVSDPQSGQMVKLEVKTNYQSSRSAGGTSKLFGKFESAWMMSEKHEKIVDQNLFYCFVNIGKKARQFRFFVVPSTIVAEYVRRQHRVRRGKDGTFNLENRIRVFRIGIEGEKYRIPTPVFQKYEDNWEFSG